MPATVKRARCEFTRETRTSSFLATEEEEGEEEEGEGEIIEGCIR